MLHADSFNQNFLVTAEALTEMIRCTKLVHDPESYLYQEVKAHRSSFLDNYLWKNSEMRTYIEKELNGIPSECIVKDGMSKTIETLIQIYDNTEKK